MIAPAFGLLALLPLMLGTTPVLNNGESAITATLCNGGTISIPVKGGEEPIPTPCQAKGCHAGCSRKRGLI